jgi:hypothetical protein
VGEVVAGLGDAGERLDAPARAAYRQRLQDLEAELAEATQWADTGRAAKLQAEIGFLREEVSAAYGLGGRARKAADTNDRARKAVTNRIRESVERIGTEHPVPARHAPDRDSHRDVLPLSTRPTARLEAANFRSARMAHGACFKPSLARG